MTNNKEKVTAQPVHRSLGFRFRILLQLLSPVLFFQLSISQGANIPSQKLAVPKTVEAPIKVAGVPYKSGGRRDPFLNPLFLKKVQQDADEEVLRGTPPSGIAGTYIAQAVLQGTSLRDDKRVAIVRGSDTRAYFLKEGDRLFDGYLKTIQNDSITLVRETKLKSGKTLTQDVIKRLRTP